MMVHDPVALGRALAAARQAEGVSQPELARGLGLCAQNICDMEKARRKIPERIIRELPPAIRGRVVDELLRQYADAIVRIEAIRSAT
jgi:transcriptional regulator with XRE-family HTH domain